MILAPDAHRLFAPDAHNRPTCPIWNGLKIVDPRYPSPEQNVYVDGSRYYSSRAGGPFLLMGDGAVLLDSLDEEQKSLTIKQKVNLSYWIYQHNLGNCLFDELSNQVLQERGRFADWMNDHRDRALKLDKAWVEGHRDRAPSLEDRTLTFLRELIRLDDASESPRTDEEHSSEGKLLLAAGGCRNDNDRKELEGYAVTQGWMIRAESDLQYSARINSRARLYVEERIRKLDQS